MTNAGDKYDDDDERIYKDSMMFLLNDNIIEEIFKYRLSQRSDRLVFETTRQRSRLL